MNNILAVYEEIINSHLSCSMQAKGGRLLDCFAGGLVRGPAHAATFAYCNPQYRACNNRRLTCSKPAGLAGGLQGDRENVYPCKKVAVL